MNQLQKILSATGDNSKAPATTHDTKWNGVKQNSLEKRKAADDTQAGVSSNEPQNIFIILTVVRFSIRPRHHDWYRCAALTLLV